MQALWFDDRWTIDPISGCHVWQGTLSNYGYGRFGDRQAHNIAWERVHGAIPAGLEPDHLCRNRACINPEHIELVTSAVNSQRGAKAKLTPEKVIAIRAETGKTHAQLGREYRVSAVTIYNVRARNSWKNIP